MVTKMKFWKEMGMRIAIAAVLFLACAMALLPQAEDYSLRLELRQERNGYRANFYWSGVDGEYSQEQTYPPLIEGRQIVIPLQKDMLGWNKKWRLDVINAPLQVGIMSFDLYKGEEKRKNFSADEIHENALEREGVEDTYSTGEDFVIKPINDDPSVNFGTYMSRAVVKHIAYHYLLDMSVVGGLILLAVFADKLAGYGKIYAGIWRHAESGKWGLLYYSLLLAGVIFLLFRDFITGNKVFVYMGDSFYQTYAQLAHAADRVAEGQWGRGFTFFESLGHTEKPLILSLKNFFVVFGREHLAYAMGIAQMLKIFAAGLCFYGFLRVMGTAKLGCCLLGIGYACNSYLIARGMWQNYPNEAVVFALWLLGFEILKKHGGKKSVILFVLVNIFCYWNYNGYSVLFYTGVSVAYLIFRYVSGREDGGKGESVLRGILTAVLPMAAGAAVAVAAWFPSLREMLGSSRVSQGAGSAGSHARLLDFTDINGFRTLFYRWISNEILGMSDYTYTGLFNWLEGPTYYCGLAAAVAVPLGLYAMGRKKRKWYLLPLAGVVIYSGWGFVRYVANGFSRNGWKLSSLWVVVLLPVIAAAAWQGEDGTEAGKTGEAGTTGRILLATDAVIVLLSLLLVKRDIRFASLWASLLFCLLLSFLLYRVRVERDGTKRRYWKYVLVLTAAAEVTASSYRVVNNGNGLTAEALERNAYYNDATQELLAEAETGQENDFYRVDKQFASTSYCDSLYQRYYGTASYMGGVGDNEYSRQFYSCMGMPEVGHIQKGTEQNTAVDALLNVRYVLARGWETNTFGLWLLAEKDGIRLYENDYALPFGYVYDEYIAQSDFMGYMPMDRRNIMLGRCVLDDGEAAGVTVQVAENPAYTAFPERWGAYRETCRVEEGTVEFEGIRQGEAAVLRLRLQVPWEMHAAGYYMQDGAAKGEFDLRMVNGEDGYFLECLTEGVDNVVVLDERQQPVVIGEAELYVIPQEEYYADYLCQVGRRRQGALEITGMGEESIRGRTEMEKDGIMVFTIPYDTGWRAYVDGEERKLLHANVGFMGLELTGGRHEIWLEYRNVGK